MKNSGAHINMWGCGILAIFNTMLIRKM